MARDRYETVKSGEWFEVSRRPVMLMQCCDCGKVHRVPIKVKVRILPNGSIRTRVYMAAINEHRRTNISRARKVWKCKP